MAKGIPIEQYPPLNLNDEQAKNLKTLEETFAQNIGEKVILVAYKDLR